MAEQTYDLQNPVQRQVSLPYTTASRYALQAPTEWGQRTSYGRAQTGLGEMLSAEIALDSAISEYVGFLQDWEQKTYRLYSELALFEKRTIINDKIVGVRASVSAAIVAAETAIGIAQAQRDFAKPTLESLEKSFPLCLGSICV